MPDLFTTEDDPIPVRGLTLYQPWASAVANGAKCLETRSWKTNYRGWLAIHAGARTVSRGEVLHFLTGPDAAHWRWAFDLPVRLGEVPDKKLADQFRDLLPRSVIVAVCRLVDCLPSEQIRDKLSTAEKAFGDFSDSRFAWLLDDVKVVKPGLPCGGARGLWPLTTEQVDALRKKGLVHATRPV